MNASTNAFRNVQLHIDQLRFTDEHNARPQGADETAAPHDELPGVLPMPVLVATIGSIGLLQPLIVVPSGELDGKQRPLYSVAAGARRLQALRTLREQGRLASELVDCREIDKAEPLLISLVENMARAPMNPVDECIAFRKLLERGQGVDSIAATFAVEPRHVERRLALAKLHPDILALVKANKMNVDAAKAWTTEPDPKRQIAVFRKMHAHERTNARYVREALTGQDLRAGDRLVRFVTLEAYRAAGGEVREDLFAQDAGDALIVTDPSLVDGLARARLQEKAEALLAQGWGWAEPMQEAYAWDIARQAQSRGLARVEAKGTQRAEAGYFVYCDQSGHLQLDGPYMPKKAARAAQRATSGGAQAGPDPDADAGERAPESLMLSLTAHKSAALQCALLNNRRVTLALLAASLQAFSARDHHLNVRVESQGHALAQAARGYELTRAGRELQEFDCAWEARIPEDTDRLAWFLEQPEEVSVNAVAYAVARSFSIMNGRDGSPGQVRALQQALGFDLADYFQATPETYLAQVPKSRIVAAVESACGKEAAAPLEGMKKGELVAAAAAKLADTRWVPEVVQ